MKLLLISTACLIGAIMSLEMGIDVSHYNKVINWSRVAANEPKVAFVLVKGSEGTNYTDERFVENFNGAKAQGLRTGFYHYFRTKSEGIEISPEDQVRNIGNKMKLVNFNPATDFFVLDVEETEKDPGLRAGPDRLPAAELSRRIQSILRQVKEKYSTAGMIYTGKSFWDSYVHSPAIDLSEYGLWIALYPNLSGLTLSECLCELTRFMPTAPNGFNSIQYWQFSNNKTVDGITTPVDVNIIIPR